jgi:hypothetical protein
MKKTTFAISFDRTKVGFERRNRLTNRNGFPRAYCETEFGRKIVVDVFLQPLSNFLAGKLSERPTRLRGKLGALLSRLCGSDPENLALIVLHPLLDSIARGWAGRDTRSADMRLCLKLGKELRDRLALNKLIRSSLNADRNAAKQILKQGRRTKHGRQAWKFLKSDWTPPECVRAGTWALECALSLDCFCLDERGFPAIAPDWQPEIDRLREELLLRDHVHFPHTHMPPDWKGPVARYSDRLEATFVRDWRAETKAAVAETFRNGKFEHAHGVNELQRTAFRIDARMLDLVDRFAVEILNHSGDKRSNDERLVRDDVSVGKVLSENDFYLTYNCDRRGRVYPIPHFNFGREDHVRALFKFAKGAPLGDDDLRWLEIHCANCEGSTDKEPFEERIRWAADNRELIQKIAAHPIETFERWRCADKPFRFVAACIELAAAWADPIMVTHLPIAFDGSCNGVQHLALLARDAEAGTHVNLIDNGTPQDAYGAVVRSVRTALELDSHKWAIWWRGRFEHLSDRQVRKLIKTPAMTYAYAVTVSGMADQITEVYRELFEFLEPEEAAALFLARKITKAAELLLPGPANVIAYIRSLAEYRTQQNFPLEWHSPTGFPVSNRYQKPKVKTVHLLRDGIKVRYRVANGCLSGIQRRKAKNASAPNFVHSLDAAHLIRVVNTAARDGIAVATVHDSFSGLAPHARRLNEIIRDELASLYWPNNPLEDLHSRNIGNRDMPLPQCGHLKAEQVKSSRYAWS